MFKDYKYSVISKTYMTSFFRFLLLSTSNVRMSEGTFCRVEVHMYFMMTYRHAKGFVGTQGGTMFKNSFLFSYMFNIKSSCCSPKIKLYMYENGDQSPIC